MDLLSLNVSDLLPLLKSGEVKAEELTAVYLARIQAHNPRLRAVLEVNAQALEQARALDALPPGQRGALHGLPVLVKDNIDVAGLHTTAGSALMAEHRPAQDAPIVVRLRQAGAVVIGKANLTEWANFMTLGMPNGYSSQGGQTVNPWKAGHDTGGSSSGSGAGVAARLAPIAIGTETSGSILSPSHQHGLIGLKPTVGLLPRTGVVPISHSQDTAGPMARTAEDAALLAGVLQGRDHLDDATQNAPHLDFTLRPGALRGARIGVVREHSWDHLESEPRALLEAALKVMQDAGAELSDPALLATAAELDGWHLEVLVYEFRADLNAYLAGVETGPKSISELIELSDTDPERLQKYGMTFLQAAQGTRGDLSERAYALARERDLRLSRTEGLDPLFAAGLDALMFPGLVGAAVGAKAGYPSVNVPVGLAGGVPVGLQLCGPAWSDAALLSLAADLHARLGGFVPAPDTVGGAAES